MKTSELSNSLFEFERACSQASKAKYNFNIISQLYKSILNNSQRFCIDGHCRAIFMVEIKYYGSGWGATPKIFYSEAEAQVEIALLKLKYPFISECRIVTRKQKEKDSPQAHQ